MLIAVAIRFSTTSKTGRYIHAMCFVPYITYSAADGAQWIYKSENVG